MKPLGTIKLRSLPADKQDEASPTLGRVFSCESISEPSRPTSWERAYASTKERYAAIVSQRALAKRVAIVTLARSFGPIFTRARHTLSRLVPTNAVNANRRSAMVVLRPAELGVRLEEGLTLDLLFSVATAFHLMSGCSGFKGPPEVWAFRFAIHELGQRNLLGLHVGRIWSCIGPRVALTTAAVGRLSCIANLLKKIVRNTRCRNLKRPSNRILHQISTGIAFAFNTLADQQSTPPHSRRLLESRPEQLRNTAKPEPVMGSSRNRRCEDSSSGDVWQFGNGWRQPQQYFLPRRTSLCFGIAVASPDTAVATV